MLFVMLFVCSFVLHSVGNIFAFQEENIFAFQERNFVSKVKTVKPMFSDVRDKETFSRENTGRRTTLEDEDYFRA